MLSIIIPTLNEENFLGSLLESIKKQDFKEEYEVIIADANSQDKTVAIARSYGCKTVEGGMPSRGRNEGAKAAKGDLLFFIDADSTLPPGFFSKLIKEFKEKKLDLASFPVYPDGGKTDKFFYTIYNSWAWLTQKFLSHATQTILIKKEIFEKVGGFDEEITVGEDHFLAKAGAQIGKFGFLKDIPHIPTSVRRFKGEGLKIYLVYFLVGIYFYLGGKFTSDIFKYHHQHPREKSDAGKKNN